MVTTDDVSVEADLVVDDISLEVLVPETRIELDEVLTDAVEELVTPLEVEDVSPEDE